MPVQADEPTGLDRLSRGRVDPSLLEQLRGALTSGGRLRLSVSGDSMRPLLRRGDRVHVSACDPDHLRRGDLLVFVSDGALVTHRLICRRAAGLLAKGDNRSDADPWISPAQVLGRVSAVERGSALLDLDSRRWRLAACLQGGLSRIELELFGWGRRVVPAAVRRRCRVLALLGTLPLRLAGRLLMYVHRW